MTEHPPEPVRFVYTNWRGKREQRHAVPLRLWFGKTDWYPDVQWFLRAWDLDRNEARDFALRYIEAWGVDPVG